MIAPIFPGIIPAKTTIYQSQFIGVIHGGESICSLEYKAKEKYKGLLPEQEPIIEIDIYQTNCMALIDEFPIEDPKGNELTGNWKSFLTKWKNITITKDYKFEDNVKLPLTQYLYFVAENKTDYEVQVYFNMAVR